MNTRNLASVGIIGGADGPTKIYVSSGIPMGGIFALVGFGCLAALVVYAVFRHKKKRK